MDLEPGKGDGLAIGELRACLTRVIGRLGLDVGDSTGIADLLLDSELRGHRDHGIAPVGIVGDFYRDGLLNPRPEVRVVRETAGALLLDGDRGGGPRAPAEAMRWCVEHARKQEGMAVAAHPRPADGRGRPVRSAGHRRGSGRRRRHELHPRWWQPRAVAGLLSARNLSRSAFPRCRHAPVVLVLAITTMALQKVRLAAEAGTSLPEGAELDNVGSPSVDPAAFFAERSLAPLGSPLLPTWASGWRSWSMRSAVC